jgi:nucleoside-diphosphate-sugar epimerase
LIFYPAQARQNAFSSEVLLATKERILVTGGAGYIGSHLVRMLLERGYAVRVLDSLAFGDGSIKVLYSNPDLELMKGDIRHIQDVVKAMDDVYGVIHLAGIVGDPACELDPEATHAINFEATKLMVEISKYKHVRRFVFASTCSVYGASEDYTLNEGSILNPVSLYAETNLRSEIVILRGFEGSDVVPSIARLATVYGVSERMRFDLVVNILSAKATMEHMIKIFGGDQWRPNVHVRDAALGFMTLLEAPPEEVRGEIFNIGSNEQNYKIKDLGELVIKCLPGTKVTHVPESPDKRSYRVSFDKARYVLGYSVTRKVEDGVMETHELLKSGKVPNYLDDKYYNVKYMYK